MIAPPGDRRPSGILGRAVAALAALVALEGCVSAEYVGQAACGQIDLMLRRRDVAEVAADPATSPRIRALMEHVPSIKAFAVRQGLTPTKSYETYVDLERPSVVWVVTASEPLRFRSKTWTFPIVGSVPYLGWFHRRDAEAFADGLRREGWDVDVRTSAAYSTLGWFSDPVLSTMIPPGKEALGDLADVVLHESVHATVYVNGQTAFNESLANFSARHLAQMYLAERFGPASSERAAYERAHGRSGNRARAMQLAYRRLEELYASSLSDELKLAHKRRLLDELREEIGFPRPINNATLAQSKVYNSGASNHLDDLLHACGDSFPRFFAALRALDRKAFLETHMRDFGKVVEPLVAAGCPAAKRSAG